MLPFLGNSLHKIYPNLNTLKTIEHTKIDTPPTLLAVLKSQTCTLSLKFRVSKREGGVMMWTKLYDP